jgi:hypothetical protein
MSKQEDTGKSPSRLPSDAIGFVFHKYFPGYGWFEGHVAQIRPDAAQNKTRRIVYADGDTEDLSLKEIRVTVDSYANHLRREKSREDRKEKAAAKAIAKQAVKKLKADAKKEGLVRVQPAISSSATKKPSPRIHITIPKDNVRKRSNVDSSSKIDYTKKPQENPVDLGKKPSADAKINVDLVRGTPTTSMPVAPAPSRGSAESTGGSSTTAKPSFDSLREEFIAKRQKRQGSQTQILSEPPASPVRNEQGSRDDTNHIHRKSNRKRKAKQIYSPSSNRTLVTSDGIAGHAQGVASKPIIIDLTFDVKKGG